MSHWILITWLKKWVAKSCFQQDTHRKQTSRSSEEFCGCFSSFLLFFLDPLRFYWLLLRVEKRGSHAGDHTQTTLVEWAEGPSQLPQAHKINQQRGRLVSCRFSWQLVVTGGHLDYLEITNSKLIEMTYSIYQQSRRFLAYFHFLALSWWGGRIWVKKFTSFCSAVNCWVWL